MREFPSYPRVDRPMGTALPPNPCQSAGHYLGQKALARQTDRASPMTRSPANRQG
ncbi:hypothetical protein ACFFX0_16570 [Citricoccus parietis]|uniref:Uncharacterized protein n=1 Tax=Citricoccus parietis TaxID=592307 RepID=A0ABV5G1B8_9MICC